MTEKMKVESIRMPAAWKTFISKLLLENGPFFKKLGISNHSAFFRTAVEKAIKGDWKKW